MAELGRHAADRVRPNVADISANARILPVTSPRNSAENAAGFGPGACPATSTGDAPARYVS